MWDRIFTLICLIYWMKNISDMTISSSYSVDSFVTWKKCYSPPLLESIVDCIITGAFFSAPRCTQQIWHSLPLRCQSKHRHSWTIVQGLLCLFLSYVVPFATSATLQHWYSNHRSIGVIPSSLLQCQFNLNLLNTDFVCSPNFLQY